MYLLFDITLNFSRYWHYIIHFSSNATFMITLSRPLHRKYALRSVDDETYIKFVNGYSLAKKLGVRGVWIYISGSGVSELCIEALKGSVRQWGRQRIATSICASATWIATPVVPLITNSTKIIRIANVTHTCIAAVAEFSEDCTSLAWLPLDMLICGQPIPMGKAGRFNLMNGDSTVFEGLFDGK